MGVDIERVMLLFQRRYNAIREIDRQTKELADALARNDGISAAMILQMRGDGMQEAERCMEEIWQMGENSREDYEKLQVLVNSDPFKAAGGTKEEEKVYEIRRKTQTVIEGLRRADQRLNQRLAGEKSFYKDKALI